MFSVSVGHLAGWRETWGAAGLGPLQKSKALIKNAINWYQKKTQGGWGRKQRGRREEGEGEREGPRPSTTRDGLGGEVWGKLGR